MTDLNELEKQVENMKAVVEGTEDKVDHVRRQLAVHTVLMSVQCSLSLAMCLMVGAIAVRAIVG